MKKENIIFIFCFVFGLLGIFYHLYMHPPTYTNPPITSSNQFFMIGYVIFSPLLLFITLMPSKKNHPSDYSNTLNVVGIILVIFSCLIYFADSLKILQNNTIAGIFLIFLILYQIFLAWYKGRL